MTYLAAFAAERPNRPQSRRVEIFRRTRLSPLDGATGVRALLLLGIAPMRFWAQNEIAPKCLEILGEGLGNRYPLPKPLYHSSFGVKQAF